MNKALLSVLFFLLTACGGGGTSTYVTPVIPQTESINQPVQGFGQTGFYSPDANWEDGVLNELGSTYEVADWVQLQNFVNSGGNLIALINSLGMNSGEYAFIKRFGSRTNQTNQVGSQSSQNQSPNATALSYYAIYYGSTVPSGHTLIQTINLTSTSNLYLVASQNLPNARVLAMKKNTTFVSGVDPLLVNQWHLSKSTTTIQTYTMNGISTTFTVLNTNHPALNLPDEWQSNEVNGLGVKIAIIDDGLDMTHPDLKGNVNSKLSCNFGSRTNGTCYNNNPTPIYPLYDTHGTMVAGIAAATKNNAVGVSGVAPKAELIGINYLDSYQTDANEIKALSVAADVLNQSYGYINDESFILSTDILNIYQTSTQSGRSNKGKIFVKSAGNGFESDEYCPDAITYKVTCQNSNMDPEQSIPYNIGVAALNHLDQKTGYSTAGSSVWISAYGGDDPYIITTHPQGNQYSYDSYSLDGKNTPLGNYTPLMNGTSAAAPMVAGVVALLLQTNPDLTWREVKYILAKTAQKLDDNLPPVTYNGITIQDAWITNGAGFNFHNWYGFGKVDTTAAVAMAEEYKTPNTHPVLPATFGQVNPVSISTPTTLTQRAETIVTLNLPDSVDIDSVRIGLAIKSNTTKHKLNIRLTSPAGTESVLLNLFSGFNEKDLNHYFLSNAFYQENAVGNWTLTIYNDNSIDATLEQIVFNVYGD